MPFRCPHCTQPGLGILAALELAADARWDERALQVVGCPRCGFLGVAVYEESRRGALDAEAVYHRGHRWTAAQVAALAEAIGACPEPSNPRCGCATHATWNAQGWDDLDREADFPITWV